MEDKNYFITNFDYEINLNRIKKGKTVLLNNKINREFEYLFFWVEDENITMY